MTLKALKDFFKTAYSWTDNISIGKIDGDVERAVCFYRSRLGAAKTQTVGGKVNGATVCCPLRSCCAGRAMRTPPKARQQSIYDFFDEKDFEIDGQRAFIISRYDGPIELGSEGNGVYEYSFEFDVYYDK